MQTRQRLPAHLDIFFDFRAVSVTEFLHSLSVLDLALIHLSNEYWTGAPRLWRLRILSTSKLLYDMPLYRVFSVR